MIHDISAVGTTLFVTASKTFPNGFFVKHFSDDNDPYDSPNVGITDTGTDLRGDMVKWATLNLVDFTISVIPDSDEDKALSAIWQANRCYPDHVPVGDVIGGIGIGLLTVGAIGAGLYNMSKADGLTKVIANGTSKETIIYRYGGANPGNLVPREVDVMSGTGLSFSTIPKSGAAMTTIEEVNATGVLIAVKDGPSHVSVYPVGTTMAGWREAGRDSIWTTTLKSIVIKWTP